MKFGGCLMKKIKCPDCGADIDVPDDVMLNEIVACPDCGLELEITKIEGDKLSYQRVVVEKEDWGE
jgi:alpha-aminoadipate carrier protein LysW